MNMMISALAAVVAVLAAAVMGFAIQRGATCAVAAVDEVVNRRGYARLLAMVEAALWVAVGLVVALQLQWLGALPQGHAFTLWTLFGAVMLGLGAFVNRACVFGAIARLGSGEWAYAATPVGYYCGCLSVGSLFGAPMSPVVSSAPLMLSAAGGALWLLLPLMAWRFYKLFWRSGNARWSVVSQAVWSPHGATIVIGFAFLITLLLVKVWAYTDVLAQLAHGMSESLPVRIVMALALLLGAMVGGYTAGRMRWSGVSVGMIARCFIGGILMAWGSLLIPGSNDGLILVGMPLLWPYAWGAFLTMCLTIAMAQFVQKRFT